MECINYITLGPIVIEIPGVENAELAVLINNTHVHHVSFLDADT